MTVFLAHRAKSFIDNGKILGVYSSKELANAAVDRYKSTSGLNKNEHYYVEEHNVDSDYWTDSYATFNKRHSNG